MNRPNLFTYATSELSQDAFICWLLSWASPKHKDADKGLHKCAVYFIHALFEKHSIEPPEKFEKVEISKQDSNIDVLCIVNGKYAILIEDKTGTSNHSNQLVRYLEKVKQRSYEEKNILPIYFKTEDQGNYTDVLEKRYKLFLREDFLSVLNSYDGRDSILLDYRDYLQSISDQVESYKSLPFYKWNRYSWMGFYIRLQNELGSGNWGYIANPHGGFLGFWWHFQGDEKCNQYLQLEQDKFCFKIWVKSSSERNSLRYKWHKTIKAKGTESEYRLNLVKPSRFGNGQYMTVCIYDGEYRERKHDRTIDIGKTIQKFRTAEALLKAVE